MSKLANIGAPEQSDAFAYLNPNAESLSEGIGSGYGVLTYRGKVWALRYRGESHIFKRTDDGSPSSYIDVVILGQAKNKSRSYYPAGYDQNTSAGQRPICASLNGIVPDEGVQQKQSEACAICPRAAFVKTAEGRQKRDCNEYKRLAVMIAPDSTKPFFGEPLMEPVFLRVPAASLSDLAEYGDLLQKRGIHFSRLLTRIKFDPEKPHPQMIFDGLQMLPPGDAPVIKEMQADKLTVRIVGENEQPFVQRIAAPQQTKLIDLQPASEDTTQAAPTVATIADDPIDADKDLNARVAKLMSRPKR